MRKHGLIVSGGEFEDVLSSADLEVPDYIIACDRGWLHARRLNLHPDVVLGDFDSSPRPAAAYPNILTFPVRKDDTDTMLAVRHALSAGCDHLTIICALGGRMDHTYANIQTAFFAASQRVPCRILGLSTVMDAYTEDTRVFPARPGWSLSVFSLSDRSVVSLSGTAYDCEHTLLTSSFPLGTSNQWAASEARITVEQGTILVIRSKMEKA